MATQFFVKYIGDRYVTVAKAKTEQEAHILHSNDYQTCSESFYKWVIENTRKLGNKTA